MTTPNPGAIDAFLAEYEALCRKHRMMIGACGCCASPWLDTAEDVAQRLSDFGRELEETIVHLRGGASDYAPDKEE